MKVLVLIFMLIGIVMSGTTFQSRVYSGKSCADSKLTSISYISGISCPDGTTPCQSTGTSHRSDTLCGTAITDEEVSSKFGGYAKVEFYSDSTCTTGNVVAYSIPDTTICQGNLNDLGASSMKIRILSEGGFAVDEYSNEVCSGTVSTTTSYSPLDKCTATISNYYIASYVLSSFSLTGITLVGILLSILLLIA